MAKKTDEPTVTFTIEQHSEMLSERRKAASFSLDCIKHDLLTAIDNHKMVYVAHELVEAMKWVESNWRQGKDVTSCHPFNWGGRREEKDLVKMGQSIAFPAGYINDMGEIISEHVSAAVSLLNILHEIRKNNGELTYQQQEKLSQNFEVLIQRYSQIEFIRHC